VKGYVVPLGSPEREKGGGGGWRARGVEKTEGVEERDRQGSRGRLGLACQDYPSGVVRCTGVVSICLNLHLVAHCVVHGEW
jgi:hypothetical protein